MSMVARDDVWRLLAGPDNLARLPVSIHDLCRAHREWYSGLVQLAQWGWSLKLEGRRLRVLPVMPAEGLAGPSMAVVQRVREMLAEAPKAVSDTRLDPSAAPVDEEIDCYETEKFQQASEGGEESFALSPQGGGEGDGREDSEDDSPEDDSPEDEPSEEEDGGFSDIKVSADPVVPGGPAAGPAGYALVLGSLTLDERTVTSTNGILAVKGSGKSYFAMDIAEEMLRCGLPFAVVEPTGAWWGLRCGADGDPAGGYPILIVGGSHADVEVHALDGGAVAEWLVDRYPVSLVCDLSLMTPDQQHTFALGFASRLFFANRRALHVFVDEADEFMPQRPQDKLENACLGAFDRLVRRGRIRGIGLTAITQRSAVLSKNVLSQVGSLFVLRSSSPQDLKAIEAWVSNVLTSERVQNFLVSLGGLQLGHAWYVSPGREPLAERITVRKRRTWDSSRTPQIGEVTRDPELRAVDPALIRDLAGWLSSKRVPDDQDGQDGQGETGEDM